MKAISHRLDRLYLGIDRRLGGRLTLLLKTAVAFDQDDGAVMSRSIAYYALFSLFPLLLVLMSFSGSVLATEEAQELVLELVIRFIPAAKDVVRQNISQVLEAQSTIGILATLGLIWSASGVFTAMYRSVNQAWGNPKSQLFWTEKLFGLGVVLIVGLLLLFTTFSATIIQVMRGWGLSWFGSELFDGPEVAWTWSWVSYFVPLVVSAILFMILYRTIPRNRITWRDVWLGGLLTGLLWDLLRRGYAWYLANFASYSLIYGSVGAIIGFLLWAYLSAMLLLIGAEFTAQHTFWRRAGRPVETRPPSQWLQEWTK